MLILQLQLALLHGDLLGSVRLSHQLNTYTCNMVACKAQDLNTQLHSLFLKALLHQ